MSLPSEIRILTVRQPWALHIIQSGKDVENRTTNIAGSYRGPIAIHAALKADEEALRALLGQPPNGIPRIFHYGAIIGVVDLVDVHYANDCYQQSIADAINLFRNDRPAFDALPITNEGGGIIGRAKHCSSWAMDYHYHLELANPRPVDPIPYRGGLGLRKITDPAVIEQLGL